MSVAISLTIHFSGGQTEEAQVDVQALKDTAFFVETNAESVERAVRDYVERALNAPARPHWVWLGDVYLFSQGVSAVVPIIVEEDREEQAAA